MTSKTTKLTTSRKTKKSPASRSKQSRSGALHRKSAGYKSRLNFLAGAVIVACALLAISIGLMGNYSSDSYSGSRSARQQSAAGANEPSLSLQPLDRQKAQSVSEAKETLTIDLYENSLTDPVNAVQSAIKYPADKLQLVSVKTGQAFPSEAATDTKTPGLIRIARSLEPGAQPLQGERQVVSLEFKVLKAVQASSEVTIDTAASYLVRSTDNQNILETSGTSIELR